MNFQKTIIIEPESLLQEIEVLGDNLIILTGRSQTYIYNFRTGLCHSEFNTDDLNTIRCVVALDNGNFILSGANNIIREYNTSGTPIREVKTDQTIINKHILLLAYQQLSARNCFTPCMQAEVAEPERISFGF